MNEHDDFFTLLSMGSLLNLLLPVMLVSAIITGCTETLKPDPNYKFPGVRQELNNLKRVFQ